MLLLKLLMLDDPTKHLPYTCRYALYGHALHTNVFSFKAQGTSSQLMHAAQQK